MSMLTPPGSRKGPFGNRRGPKPVTFRPRRKSARRRIALAVAAAVAVGAAAWGGVQLFDAYGGGKKAKASAGSDAATCASSSASASASARTAAAASLPAAKSVTVNVLNATTRTGLAKDTADALKKRGFRIGKVGNAPDALNGKVKGTAELLAGAKGAAAAKLVGAEAAGAQPKADSRTDTSVDLVLGDTWKGLATPQQVAAALHPDASPRTHC
ncbi:hypothetical protein BIV57_15255 [Mangrovactinospora gilvigrisea]|uniref:LytR/CpsA/Psr regulator C-terminal domain-containing protein n=1 Tax=Mangrovactinospora gilvigrisea TaxID=1428644 RepID=A0A1J7BDF6_9ACTN|nr:LytR C-terminal domain-containing protein [Mangrovactinospora gilvigrisea]OIV36613.1 hypothetical protein BIV57_15255 [Mangrovactinospora gilvigrisea]